MGKKREKEPEFDAMAPEPQEKPEPEKVPRPKPLIAMNCLYVKKTGACLAKVPCKEHKDMKCSECDDKVSANHECFFDLCDKPLCSLHPFCSTH